MATAKTTIQNRTRSIRRYLLANAEKPGLAAAAAKKFGMTRQAVNLHLQQLTEEGLLLASGSTRNRLYELAVSEHHTFTYPIQPALAEDIVWAKDIRSLLQDLPSNVLEIWNFGFTEIFNNAIDHSRGTTIGVEVFKTTINTKIVIMDNGVGIFKKIQKEMNLVDERHAILELSKGKLTTDAKNHAGWGIFFTSRVMDQFNILSGGVYFSHDFGDPSDWVFEAPPVKGTAVMLELSNTTKRTKKKVFDRFSVKNKWGFNRTVVPVDLVRYGNDQLVSRSQAKRLLARVDQFAEVVFDFDKVETIGQAFADEIFRVFAVEHPHMKLTVISANREVRDIITGIKREARRRT